jgi:general nucleoside transport system permease protein
VGIMTATVERPDASNAEVVRTPAEIRRAKVLGAVYILLALGILWFFARGTTGNATFGLTQPTDRFTGFPDLVVPSAGLAYLAAFVLAAVGTIQLIRGMGNWTNAVLAVMLALVLFTFLAWAAAGKTISMVGMMRGAINLGVPIALGALSGVLCERVAVINIAIEGMLLGGAFVGALVGSVANNVVGLIAAVAAGTFLAWILAIFAIRYRVDQIIVGVVLNIFVLGLTGFLAKRLTERNPDLNSVAVFRPIGIPLLQDIPFLGPILFNQNIFVYALYIVTAGLTFGLFRTKWGLRSRAVGEHPKAADTLGVPVYRMRYLNVLLGGALAGFGGAFFTLGSVGRFDDNMTAGRGFIALAAMIVGRWHPVGAVGGALLFGFADSMRIRLALVRPIPSEFLAMAPYIATIIVVAGLIGRARPPAADGQPYVKE